MNRARDIAEALEARKLAVLRYLLPAGKVRGDEYEVGNLRGEPGRSLRVHLNGKGTVWSDFAGNERGADLLDLWVEARCNGDRRAAMREAADWLGLDTPARATRTKAPRPTKPARPPTAATAAPPERHPTLGQPTLRHEYHDAAGRLIFYHCRFDPPGRDKEFRPLAFKEGAWRWQDPEGLLPLYGLAELAARPGDPVLIVEGEKAADVARDLLPDDVMTTWPHGAKAVDRVDWSPLAGRQVVLWPDNDESGLDAMKAVAKALRTAGATSVRIVELPAGLPPKWDLGDELPAGLDVDRLEALIGKAPEAPTALRAVDFGDLVTMELPPRESLLGPWLTQKGLVELYGWRGTGKTLFSLGVALAAASCGRFLRWEAPKARRVLYLDGELPAQALQEMCRTVAAALDLQPEPGMLRFVTPDLLDGFPPDLSTPEGQAMVDELLPGVELLIVDNLATLTGRTEENEGAPWLPIQGYILSLRRRGIAVILVHHGSKAGGSRGHSRRQDVLDTVIALRRPKDYTADQGARFELHFEKNRGFYGAAAKPFEAQLEARPDGRPTWTTRDLDQTEVVAAAELVRDGLSQRQIAKELGVSQQAVSKRLRKARKLGLLGGDSRADD